MKLFYILAGVLVLLFVIGNIINYFSVKEKPKIDITTETTSSLASILVVGKISKEDVQLKFGDPKYIFSKVDNFHPAKSSDKFLADQRWGYERRKNPLVFVSLDVYFSNEGIVSGYVLKNNY